MSSITTVLSLFDGISCARVALERLGYTDILYLASEVDKYAIQIAQKNFPDTIQLGDVRNIKRENLPQVIDLLIGGSPCQDLSIAKNNRQGLDGERSGLFWEWVRLWRECQPRYWVLENVNSMPKEAKRIISETLGVEPIMINAALVSAQNRKRLFWTNIATDIFGHCHIPLPEDRGILLRDILESGTAQNEINKSYCIDANYYKGGKKDTHNQSGKRLMVIDNIYPSGGQNGNVYDTEGKSPTLSAGTGIAGRGIGSSNAPKVAEPVFVAGIGENGKASAIPSTYYKENIKSLDQRKKTGLIVKEEADKPIRVGDIGTKGQAHRVYSDDGKSVSLSTASGGQGSATGLYAIPEARGVALRSRTRHDNHADEKYEKLPEISGEKANAMTSVQTDSMVAVAIPEATKKGYAIAEEGDSVDLSYPNSKTRRGRVSKKAPSQMTSSQSVGVLEGYTIRKLTPTECERLMTLPTWEIITEVEICSDLAKNYVNAVNKSPKLQKLVGSVEKIELQQYVEYVGRKLRENNPKTEHIVQENATTQTMNSALNHTENRKTELPMCAKYVGKNSRCPNPVVEEDIVLWNAFISITGGPSAPNGGEVSLLRERHYVTRLNGNKSLRLSGNEIMQLAKDVENGSITKRDNNTTYITLSRLGIKNIELMLIILYYYAVIAIDGCMEKEIRTNYLSMRCYNPYTANGVNVNGKHIAISNTQRYKTLGNGFVVEVVKHILSYMEGLEKGETRLGIKKDTKEEEQ